MKYNLPDKDHPCTVYDNHINMVKMNIKEMQYKYGYLNAAIISRVMAFEIMQVEYYILLHNPKDAEQLDGLENLIDDLSLYLQKD